MSSVANTLAKPLAGIIADDLTGAAELAGAAWRYGRTAEISTEPAGTTEAQVIALDTDSRLCATAEAVRRVAAAARHLQTLNAGWIYKKVDSVLRGSVLAETEALLDTLHLNRALLVPANPGLGRVIRDGKYFVAGVPVHETDFRNDPQHPRTSPQVLDLLGRSATRAVTLCRPDQALPASGIIVGEAGSKEDLQAWAKKADSSILLVGAAEFFAAILRAKSGDESHPAFSPVSVDGPTLFVCGSMAASARDFLAACRQRGWPVLPMPAGALQSDSSAAVANWAKEIAASLARQRCAVVTIEQPTAKATPAQLTSRLVAAVAMVLRETGVARINIEGGATAAALIQAMGWKRLPVWSEVAPGVVTLRAGQGGDIALTMKPGSYQWPAALCA